MLFIFSCSRGVTGVTSISVSPNGTSLGLSWAPVPGVTEYEIFLSNSPSVSPSNYTSEFTSNTTSVTIPGLTIGNKYYLVVVPMVLYGFSSGPPSSVVTADLPGYVYASIYGSAELSVFTVGSGGALSLSSSPSTGTGPATIAITPNGQYLYVADSSGSQVSAYTIGSDGTLNLISSYGTGSGPIGLAISPNGEYLYVSNSVGNTISGFLIGSGGVLSPLTGSPFCSTAAPCTSAPLSRPYGMAISPDGAFLYVADDTSNLVSAFSVAANGALTDLSNSSTGTGPWGVAVSPNGANVYVSNDGGSGTGSVSAFSIGSGGTLAAIPCSTCSTGNNSNGIAVTPDGNYLYIANNLSSTISAFSIGSGGALSQVGTPLNIGAEPVEVAISFDGLYLYTDNASGTVSAFTIGSNGALSKVSNGPFVASGGPWGIAISP